MSSKSPNPKVTAVLARVVGIILVLLPFHAFLTVWLNSLVGHYTVLRLWKEYLLLVLVGGGVYLFLRNPKLRWKLISYKLHWLIAAYLLVQVLWGIVALALHQVDAKALGYAWIIDNRFLLFYLAVWAVALHVPRLIKAWPRWVIWPLVAVVLFGLLQYFVLPYDWLKHVGYSESTIYPYETINHNIHRLRIMSTLRGANPLGAYMVLALSLVAALWQVRRRWWLGVVFVSGLMVLLLSFSRSAWIGLALSIGFIIWSVLRTARARKLALTGLAGFVAVCALVTAALWHNTTFQDAIFHTNQKSTIATSSNQGHASALRGGVIDMLKNPFGRGPGSAGPASVYNNHPARISENYFVQVGQETGWIGFFLFIAINIVIARALWRRRNQALALGLLGAFAGLTFVNLLSHAWADDTLAYLWWGLAALAVTTVIGTKDENITA